MKPSSRILFASYAMSHMVPCLPLAHELAERGHEVLFVTQDQGRERLTHPGIRFIPWNPLPPGGRGTLVEYLQEVRARATEAANWYRGMAMVSSSQAAIHARVYRSLTPIFRNLSPDLVVVSNPLVPGIDLAHELGLSCIVQAFFVTPELRRHPLLDPSRSRNRPPILKRLVSGFWFLAWKLAEAQMEMARKRCGARGGLADRMRATTVLAISAPCLESGDTFTPKVHLVGPMIPKSLPPLPDDTRRWIERQPEGFVLVVFGTMVRLGERQLRALALGLAGCGLGVLWALPGPQQRVVRDLIGPAFRLESYVNQIGVLSCPGLRAFVSHAGANSTMEALYHGRPILALPFSLDQVYYASRIQALGAGLRLDAHAFTDEDLGQALHRILHQPGFSDTASRLGDELRRTPGVAGAADVVEAELAHGRTVTAAH